MFKRRKNIFLVFVITLVWIFTLPAFSVLAEEKTPLVPFFVEAKADAYNREQVQGQLMETSQHAYFFVDQAWWEKLSKEEQAKDAQFLQTLGKEFDAKIYPGLTATYGFEWKPGIDNDLHISILFHPMKEGEGGYFRSADEHEKLQSPTSNEREMVYLNANYLPSSYLDSLLAHEFTHLITYNQKNRKEHVEPARWLNEARAEYSPTLLGYDQIYQGSNLQRRTKIFLEHPTDSLTEWRGTQADYGALNLFTQYLVEHYGKEILIDSLHSPKVGLAAINEALKQNGFKDKFSEIFTNWTIASYVNDCSISLKYCYLDPALKNLHVTPKTYFLPLAGVSSLSSTDQTKNWAGKWIRFIGGDGDLTLRFVGSSENFFEVPYVIQPRKGKTQISFLKLSPDQHGLIHVPDFSTKDISLTIIPSIQSKMSGFDGLEESYPFFWEAKTDPRLAQERQIAQLQKTIQDLKEKIEILHSQLACLLMKQEKVPTMNFQKDLFFGLRHNAQVKALQAFLKAQGKNIYPEGLITGNYLWATERAVKRFQEEYAAEILKPLGLSQATGYFGLRTREKVNALLNVCSHV